MNISSQRLDNRLVQSKDFITSYLPAATKLWPRLCFYTCLWFCPQGGSLAGRAPRAGRPPWAGRAPRAGRPSPQQGDPPPSRENPPGQGDPPMAGRPSQQGDRPRQGDPPGQGDPPERETPQAGRTPAGRPSPQQGEPPWAMRPPCGRETPWAGRPPPRETPQAGRPPGQGDPPPGKENPLQQGDPPAAGRPPPGRETPRHTVNERPVRILLEFILVWRCIWMSFVHWNGQIFTNKKTSKMFNPSDNKGIAGTTQMRMSFKTGSRYIRCQVCIEGWQWFRQVNRPVVLDTVKPKVKDPQGRVPFDQLGQLLGAILCDSVAKMWRQHHDL